MTGNHRQLAERNSGCALHDELLNMDNRHLTARCTSPIWVNCPGLSAEYGESRSQETKIYRLMPADITRASALDTSRATARYPPSSPHPARRRSAAGHRRDARRTASLIPESPD